MRASLYSNENFPRRAVEELRRLGNNVINSYEAGRANQKVPDEEVLAFATGQQRAVLTLNRLDFIRLHRIPKEPMRASSFAPATTRTPQSSPIAFIPHSITTELWPVS